MASPQRVPLLPTLPILVLSLIASAAAATRFKPDSSTYSSNNSTGDDHFIKCFHDRIPYPLRVSGKTHAGLVLTREANRSAFEAAFFSSVNNKLYSRPRRWPLAIVLPSHAAHVQATVLCARSHPRRLVLRIRSGGHDFAGISYNSVAGRGGASTPFVLLDLANGFRSIRLDLAARTAWAGAGATVGELYYHVSRQSHGRLGFPAGICPTIGLGGHLSGGGLGTMVRSNGTAADHVVDALLVDAAGRVLDRAAMGEDLFWAIRGGGGASFAVVLEYKLQLVDVPSTVTVFEVGRTVPQGALALLDRWQLVASRVPKELHLAVVVLPNSTTNATSNNPSDDVVFLFQCMYLGRKSSLLRLLGREFPELRVAASDCLEVGWLEAAHFHASNYRNRAVESFLDRTPIFSSFYQKIKYDFVQRPIPKHRLDGIWEWISHSTGPAPLHNGSGGGLSILFFRLEFTPMGGVMDEIPEAYTPFPHRKGNLYRILYQAIWSADDEAAAERHVEWLRDLYRHMTPFVSHHPRRAYLNSRDLDLGTNPQIGIADYKQATDWGTSYFKDNFRRLAAVKGKVDPDNFFWSEQSIPPIA